MKDVFPKKDREFIETVKKFKNAVIAQAGDFDFSADELNEMDDAVSELEDAYKQLNNLKISVKTARQNKDSIRKKVERIVRGKAGRIYANGQISKSQLVGLGLRPHDDKLTRINAPDDAPRFVIKNSLPLRHIIRFWEKGSERRRRKPKGVVGAEIWRKIEGVDDEYYLIGTAMSSPYEISYKPEYTGKQAHYYLLWITRRGEKSPPSAKQNATITG